ncbi:MAG: DUF2617 family protein [Phycisphaerales bacterium]|nr:MAG: DUF2617 family protein [Phycisphaerales bacterium]
MNIPQKTNSLQSYQTILYNRALHPELFTLKARRVLRHGPWELELWLMPGGHLLRFEHHAIVASELVTDQEDNLPELGVVTTFMCAGEHEVEHEFPKDRLTYMTAVQTETLSENLFASTYEEMAAHGREVGGLMHEWRTDAGTCLSLLDVQKYAKEAHVQAYHLLAPGGVVLRTQSIFELR